MKSPSIPGWVVASTTVHVYSTTLLEVVGTTRVALRPPQHLLGITHPSNRPSAAGYCVMYAWDVGGVAGNNWGYDAEMIQWGWRSGDKGSPVLSWRVHDLMVSLVHDHLIACLPQPAFSWCEAEVHRAHRSGCDDGERRARPP
jgi:hypothetical protein